MLTLLSNKSYEAGLNQDKCFQRLQLAFGDESPYRVTVFGWFEEFFRGHNSLQDEERTGMPRWQ
ncbi:UNVERIFIED_CONTAM: hypothetical protein NCL1_37894 [Trichonephila clavipes]